MPTPETMNKLEALLRTWLDAERSANWEYLRSVPSTHTWRAVDYLRERPAHALSSLMDAFVARGLHSFDPAHNVTPPFEVSAHPELEKMNRVVLNRMLEYPGVRTLRMMLGESKRGSFLSMMFTPPGILERAERINPTNSREIRAVVKKVLFERFGARPEDRGGGCWCYTGTCRGRPFTVSIDYASRASQLRYSISFQDLQLDLQVKRVSYELLAGAGRGDWDYLTAENLQPSIERLGELVEKVAAIPDQLASE